MRAFAGLLVAAGAAIMVLTIPLVNASNQTAFTAHLEYCKSILSMSCLNSPAPESSYAPGFIVGAVVAGFGVLLLAIRRPTSLSNQNAVDQDALSYGEKRKCPYCAEVIKAEAIKCRFCGSDLAKDPPNDSHQVEPSQETPGAASSPTMMCPSCGASIFPTQRFCDVCSATIARAGTWHLILDRRVAEERREVLLTALRDLSLDPAVRTVNEREVKIASGTTPQQVNALMIRLHELGVISRKQRD